MAEGSAELRDLPDDVSDDVLVNQKILAE